MAYKRELRFYELINSRSNVNFMLDFECDNLKKVDINKAFKLVKKRHPYFRMQIKLNDQGKPEFLENQNLDENIYLEHFQLTSKSDLSVWKSRLIQFGSNENNANNLVCFELYSFDNRFHQLLGSVNHAGIDGPGLFQMLRDFCSYLDRILRNEECSGVESKVFLDVHGNYEHSFDLSELKNEPVVKDIIESVKPIGESTEAPIITSKFFQFDEATTNSLVNECKKNSVTIQAALSTAIMLSHLNYKKAASGKFLNSCPCNMRSYLANINADDIICGSAALIWDYDVNLDDLFWGAAQKTNGSIKAALSSNYCFKWWVKLANSIPTQSYSVMGSSMGIVSLNEDKLKSLKINDLRFLGSSYKLIAGVTGIMVHAFTFMNRFTMNLSFTYPALTEEWAKTYSDNIWRILQHIAERKLDKANLKEVIGQLEKHNQ